MFKDNELSALDEIKNKFFEAHPNEELKIVLKYISGHHKECHMIMYLTYMSHTEERNVFWRGRANLKHRFRKALYKLFHAMRDKYNHKEYWEIRREKTLEKIEKKKGRIERLMKHKAQIANPKTAKKTKRSHWKTKFIEELLKKDI